MNFDLRTATEADAETASALVIRSFGELAAANWEPAARQVFVAGANPDALRAKILPATYVAASFSEGQMICFLLMPRPTHLGMLFVHPEWLHRGVGRALWESARTHLEVQFPETTTVEINATRYGLGFYQTAGFLPISKEFERDGCRVTRMACWLRARAFGAECLPPGAALCPEVIHT